MLEHGQVTPQQATMTFLPGEEKVMDMEVFAPIKGPLDLYILMDFSNSMKDDLSNLKRMGKELGEWTDAAGSASPAQSTRVSEQTQNRIE